MFNKQYNGGQSINANTHFFNSYSDTAMVKIGAWNQHLSLKIHPAIGKDSSGVTTYAQDQSQIISTSITQDAATALYDGFEKKILPYLDTHSPSEKVSISVSSGEQKKIISIYYDGNDAYLEIATSVNDQNITTEQNVITHKFNKKEYMVNYDYHTGNASATQVVETELLNFMDKVKGVKDLAPTIVHTFKYAQALKNAFGRNNAQGNGNGFIPNTQQQQPQQTQQPYMPAPMQNASSMDEFLPFV